MTPELAALQAIGWPLDTDGLPTVAEWRELMAAHPQARPARVVEQHRSGYVVAVDTGHSAAVESLPEWQRAPSYKKGATAPEARPGVGDWVLIERKAPDDATADQGHDQADSEPDASDKSALASSRIVALLPRRSAIKRGAAGEHYKQQLIAANIDTVFVVCGLDADFNPRRIERYLLLVRGGGEPAAPEPVIVLTKSDLASADDADAVPGAVAALIELAAQGIAVRAVNARDPESVAALNPWLGPGRTAVLVGSSGAGKSTLTNSLLGIERMKTGEVRESDSRGRHTTTHRALLPLPTGGCLIDTPGMRELKPTGEEDVAENFSDIETLAEQCRFRDCAHAREPGCAVRAAIEGGKLDPQRFANYLKLSGEVAGAAGQLAHRRAQKADEKVSGKPPVKRPDDRHGRR